MEVVVVETSELGDRTYVASDGDTAMVIDPQRDIDRVLSVLSERSWHCSAVFETHIHNDYVSGGLELARQTGATYFVSRDDDVAFSRHGVGDGDEFRVGAMNVRVVATPGHTDHHLAFVVDDGGLPVVFTGGSLLYGSVGRTDLVDPTRTEELTRQQYRSARRLSDLLPDDADVYPTHGFGSFCSSGAATGGAASTIALERERNDALTTQREDDFVEKLVSGLSAYPTYYAHMGPRNREGAGRIDLSLPERANADELRKRIDAGEWVVDLRSRVAFARSHVRGTIGVPLDNPFATYLGWLVPWETPITLISNRPDDITAAQTQLVRIGIDRPEAYALGEPEDLALPTHLSSYPIKSFSELDLSSGGAIILDVRRNEERAESYFADSVHIPLHELERRIDELPRETIWVHCASGYRASLAASLLDRAGRDVVLINDDWANRADARSLTTFAHGDPSSTQ